MSGHPFEQYSGLAKEFNFNAGMIKDLEPTEEQDEDVSQEEILEMHSDITDGMQVYTGGVITEVKKLFTKVGNKPMAVVKIEDLYGSIEVMVFTKFYEKIKEQLVEEAVVTVSGKLSIREGERPIIIMDKMNFIDENSKQEETEEVNQKLDFNSDVGEKVVKTQKLYMQFDVEDESLKAEIFNILDAYPGKTETFVQYNRKLYLLGRKVEPTTALLSELYATVGEKNVKLI